MLMDSIGWDVPLEPVLIEEGSGHEIDKMVGICPTDSIHHFKIRQQDLRSFPMICNKNMIDIVDQACPLVLSKLL